MGKCINNMSSTAATAGSITQNNSQPFQTKFRSFIFWHGSQNKFATKYFSPLYKTKRGKLFKNSGSIILVNNPIFRENILCYFSDEKEVVPNKTVVSPELMMTSHLSISERWNMRRCFYESIKLTFFGFAIARQQKGFGQKVIKVNRWMGLKISFKKFLTNERQKICWFHLFI